MEPLRQAREQVEIVRRRPGLSISTLLLTGALVGLVIWGWPELHRTAHIHRM